MRVAVRIALCATKTDLDVGQVCVAVHVAAHVALCVAVCATNTDLDVGRDCQLPVPRAVGCISSASPPALGCRFWGLGYRV